jgi:hypothetical protein
VLIIAILFFGYVFPKFISSVSSVALYPFHQVAQWYRTSATALPFYLRSRTDLMVEITELQKESAMLGSTQLSVRRLLAENMALRTATNFGTSTQRVVSRVIAQSSLFTYDQIQIDKGSNSGIAVGAPVFVGLDTVIGAVVYTASNYSLVELLTTPGFTATAYVVGPNIFADLEGVGGGVARVRVPQGVDLSLGNLVLLPSVASGVYGEIISLENPPSQPEQYGYVTPPVPLQSLFYVSVALDVPRPVTDAELDENIQSKVRSYFSLDRHDELIASSTDFLPANVAVDNASNTNASSTISNEAL